MPEYQTGYEEVLPEGAYDFVCVDANERTSQSGNTMIELRLIVKGPNGKNEVRLYDHLTFVSKSYWKIDTFRVATGENLVPGQTVRFEAEDCIDRQGKVWLTIETFKAVSVTKSANTSTRTRRIHRRRRIIVPNSVAEDSFAEGQKTLRRSSMRRVRSTMTSRS